MTINYIAGGIPLALFTCFIFWSFTYGFLDKEDFRFFHVYNRKNLYKWIGINLIAHFTIYLIGNIFLITFINPQLEKDNETGCLNHNRYVNVPNFSLITWTHGIFISLLIKFGLGIFLILIVCTVTATVKMYNKIKEKGCAIFCCRCFFTKEIVDQSQELANYQNV